MCMSIVGTFPPHAKKSGVCVCVREEDLKSMQAICWTGTGTLVATIRVNGVNVFE